jgi:DNA processing protein
MILPAQRAPLFDSLTENYQFAMKVVSAGEVDDALNDPELNLNWLEAITSANICNELIRDLNENGHNAIIVSGLAYGIDIVSHKAALKNSLKTIAVLGHGLDRIYPSSHKKIAKNIISQGALLTEFLSDTNPDRANFVKRNRIIAGLSDATIVVESAEKGGSLITADIANSYNRDVFAFPGRVNDKYSVGCNKFIKSNRAALIENFKDLEYILGWDVGEAKPKVIQKKLFVNLSDDEKIIVEFLKENDKQSIDIICVKTNFPMSKVSAMLLNLEFSGIVKSLPGKYYSLSN